MRLIAASVVLNEIDIIEAFVRHNLSIVSKLLVIDNGSTDGTRQVLQSLVEEGLPLEVQDEPTVGYRNRLLFQNHLRKLAIANPEIEWFLPLDADEFLLAENAQELIPAQATPESPVALRWQSFASTSGDDAQEQNPVRRVRHRLVEEGWPWTKILLPRSLVLDETVKLLPGQHGVERNGQNLEPVFSDVQMAHFPIRSPGQYISKVVSHVLQKRAASELETAPGWIYRKPFQLLLDNPAAFMAYSHEASQRYALPDGLDFKPQLTENAFPYRGSELRYTPQVDDLSRGWLSVLRQAIRMADALRSCSVSQSNLSLTEQLQQMQTLLGERETFAWVEIQKREKLIAKLEAALKVQEFDLAECQRMRNSWTWKMGRLIIGPVSSLRRFTQRIQQYGMQKREQLREHRHWSNSPRVLIGAGGTSLPGWRTTDGDVLDLRNRGHFANKWKPNSRAAFLAEHVWEHLTPVDAITAVNICFEFLKPGGRLRIAVPDGWHPDPGYIERVRPGGSGPGCDDHKVLFTYESLGKLLESAGFEVQLLEYWDENRHFHQAAWSAEDGPIRRSARTDSRNAHGQLNYTSLIVDAIKPLPRSRVNQLLDRLRRKWLSKFAPFTHAIGQIRS